MKKSLLFIIAFTVMQCCVFAQQQDTLKFDLENGIQQSKQFNVKSNISKNLMCILKCEWDSTAHQIHIEFDRTGLPKSDIIFCFSLAENAPAVTKMTRENEKESMLWKESETKDIKKFQYFLDSKQLKGDNYNYYKTLPCEISMDRFTFLMNNSRDSVIYAAINIYLLLKEDKPLSKKDMKLEAKAAPVILQLNLIRPEDPTSKLCGKSEKVIAGIQEKIAELKGIKSEIEQVKNKSYYAAFTADKQAEVMQKFKENYPEWSDYGKCDKVEDVIKNYTQIRKEVLDINSAAKPAPKPAAVVKPTAPKQAVPAAPAVCDIDFDAVNKNLMNLQIEILKKTNKGESVDYEKNEYTLIKADTDKKINLACHKDHVDEYRRICANVEKALIK
jgi:hypothetical protein